MSRSHPTEDSVTSPAPEAEGNLPAPTQAKWLDARTAAGGAFVVILAAIFGRPLYHLMVYAMGTSLHSHVVLVPFISAYLITIERASLPRETQASLSLGALFGVGGAAAFIAARHSSTASFSENDHLALITFSFLCFLWAGGFVSMGRAWMRAAAFPLAFLLFMVPLPDAAVEWLETASKYASAEAAAFLLGVVGAPMFREGLVFRLPGIAIEVAQECSGIRSSWVLFITSLLASHLFLRTNWRRAVLVAFVIPLGIIRNGFRIAVIGWLCVRYGPHMIDSIIHRRGGPFFFVLSLGPLFALLWWLRRSETRKDVGAAPASRR